MTNSILFNYPLNSNQIESLEAELSEINRKINFIIIVSTSNYDLIKKIRSNYLTCPICERLFKKEEMKDNEKFVCPEDNEFQFLKEEIQKFHEFAIENHLVNSKKTIEKLLKENKITTSNIINLTVDNEKDIFSGEIQEKILKVIMNL
ncbi:hypothetical protein [endosymbiont GvMRE of Glomus versiforme]|uniref:hypothetical protein n=1 Tax=endosymbiont GvMRE of Glomus versiforme TaxID=2039283 RepID=UPI0011C3B845|nr:hypothetical protein [endosymbiont GvMRE of Glomus versiforme]